MGSLISFQVKGILLVLLIFFMKTLAKIKHNYIWNNKFISYSILANFIICIAFFILIFVITNGRTDSVPLSYNVYYGSNGEFGPIQGLFIFPEICLVFFLINSFLCYYYYKYNRVLSYFLIASLFLINILAIIAFILLILFIEL